MELFQERTLAVLFVSPPRFFKISSMKVLLFNTMRQRLVTACSATLLLVVSSIASSTSDAQTVLYSDTFNRTTGSGDGNGLPAGDGNGFSDWGTADNGAGGTETVVWSAGRPGAMPPTGGAQFTTNGSRAHVFEGAVNTTVNAAALAPDGFSVAFDFSRIDTALTADPTNGFVAVGTGYDQAISEFSPFETTGNSQFAVLFQQSANGNVANGNVFIDGTATANFDYLDPLAQHSVLITFTPAVSGSYGANESITATIVVDGVMLYNDTITGGGDFGDLSFATNLFTAAYIENLVVSSLSTSTVLLGDVNLDGEVNFLDIAPFIAVLSSNGSQAEADIDQNGMVEFLDIQPFINVLSGN